MEFVRSPNYTAANRGVGDIDFIVIHTTESTESSGGAETIARYFSRSSAGVSAHYVVDNDSTVRCVEEKNIAWHAPPNSRSIGIELVGRASQTAADWDDKFSRAQLRRAAKLVAKLSEKYDIPVRHLSARALAEGGKGIVGHVDVTNAFHMTTHTDPGANFPWDWFLTRVRRYRWVYVQYRIRNKAGKVVAKSGVAKATNTKFFKNFVVKHVGTLRKALNAKIEKRRKY